MPFQLFPAEKYLELFFLCLTILPDTFLREAEGKRLLTLLCHRGKSSRLSGGSQRMGMNISWPLKAEEDEEEKPSGHPWGIFCSRASMIHRHFSSLARKGVFARGSTTRWQVAVELP